MKWKCIGVWAFMAVLLFSQNIAFGQAPALDMLDALDVVRDTYGADVPLMSGRYNDASRCWQIELEDTVLCVSDTSGEFIEVLDETSAQLPDGTFLAIGLFIFAILTFIAIQRLNVTSIDEDTNQSFLLSLPIPINRLAYGLGLVAGYLALQSIVARWIQSSLTDSPEAFDTLVRFININLEQSLPTWYASILLVIAAGLAYVIAQTNPSNAYRRHWFGLSLLFVYLSIDEAIAIHEELTIPLRELLGASGIFYFAWVIIGMMLVAIVGLAFLRFVLNMPTPVRNLFILSGALFIGGAIGIESLSAALYEETGTTAIYSTIGTVEELFEMLGVIVCIRALILYSSISHPHKTTKNRNFYS